LLTRITKVDLLLVSHAHTDHLDYPTLRQLQSPTTIAVTAQNTTSLWEDMKFRSIEEMAWRDSRSLAEVKVTAIEGKHWGARLPWYKGMEANSLLLSKNGVNIFFGADTGYTELIKQQLNGIPIDLAIMGIAAYSPKSFETRHANPEQAWKMAEEMSAKWVIPNLPLPSGCCRSNRKGGSSGGGSLMGTAALKKKQLARKQKEISQEKSLTLMILAINRLPLPPE